MSKNNFRKGNNTMEQKDSVKPVEPVVTENEDLAKEKVEQPEVQLENNLTVDEKNDAEFKDEKSNDDNGINDGEVNPTNVVEPEPKLKDDTKDNEISPEDGVVDEAKAIILTSTTDEGKMKEILKVFNEEINCTSLVHYILANKEIPDIAKIFFGTVEVFLFSTQKSKTNMFIKEVVYLMKKHTSNKEVFDFLMTCMIRLFTKYNETEFSTLKITRGIYPLQGGEASDIISLTTVFSKVSKKNFVNDSKVVSLDKALQTSNLISVDLAKAIKNYYTV